METKKKQQIIEKLILAVQKLPISLFYRELFGLDTIRRYKIINSLTPEKFLELIEYDYSLEEEDSWINIGFMEGEKFDKKLLDTLSPELLIYLARNNSNSWGLWHYEVYGHKDELIKKNNSNDYCSDLSDYFSISSVERVAEIINFLINSCQGVTAPREEEDRNVFLYEKNVQFPWEVTYLLSSVHPKVFFPALNLISANNFNGMIWMCKKTIREYSQGLENIFQDEFDNPFSLEKELFKCIGKNIGILKDKYLIIFLNDFSQDVQKIIFPQIGKKRIVELHKNKFSLEKLFLPEEWNLFNKDKNSNEGVLEKILKQTQSVGRLSAKKKVELLGALL